MLIELDYHPSKRQRVFHQSMADDLLYGGAAGGGKSKAVVMDALINAIKYPGCVIYCIRRTYRELDDTLITEMKKSYPDEIGFFNKGDYNFYVINGSEIRFRHCQNAADVKNFDGAEIAFLYVDELTHFTKPMYDHIGLRMRANEKLGLKPQKKNTSNPGGIGHTWVKNEYLKGALADELRTKRIWSNYLGKYMKTSIQFIPAQLIDNPYIGENYVMQLEMKPENMRKAYLDGDWNIFEGQAFEEWKDDPEHYVDQKNTHVVAPFEIPEHWRLYRGYDYGYGSPYSTLWFAQSDNARDRRLYLIAELYGGMPDEDNKGLKETVDTQANKILKIERQPYMFGKSGIEIDMSRMGTIDGVADPSITDTSGGTNDSIYNLFWNKGVIFRDPNYDPEVKRNVINNRLQGKQLIHDALRFDERGFPGFQVFSTCEMFIQHFPELLLDPNNPEDVSTEGEDHDYDALRYIIVLLKPKVSKPAEKKAPKGFDPFEEPEYKKTYY